MLLLFLLLSGVFIADMQAQEEFDMPRRSRRAKGGIVGGGVSFIPTWTFTNTATLNEQLALPEYDMPGLDDGGMLMLGAQMYGYIMVVPNLRVGAQWYGGSMNKQVSANGIYRETALATASGGLLLEYVLPFKRFHIAFGGMVGIGHYTLTLTRGPDAQKSWADASTLKDDTRSELTNSFFAWQPSVTFEYDLHPFVVLGLTSGYYGSSGNEWEYNGNFPLQDFPDPQFGGAFVRLGLTVGLFLGEW